MDFLRISVQQIKKGKETKTYICPKFVVKSVKDLMIRGGKFYAIWNEKAGFWSKDQDDVVDLIDSELEEYKASHPELEGATIKYMWDCDSGSIDKWKKYVEKQMTDNYHPLDEKLIFSNEESSREDYVTHKVPYPIVDIETPAWNELVSTLYSPEERHKIEWMIGAIVSGESRELQKFLVFYGAPGTGKSTILNIIEKMFDGYCSTFDSRALGSASSEFALEPFKANPLVAIQHDGDLSRIEDNTRLNSIVSHEPMTVNVKYGSMYVDKFHTILLMGTNKPVKITDSKSGILRRLIDVQPSNEKVTRRRYNKLIKDIDFELGGIAKHCLDIYEENRLYYDSYIPFSMMSASNDFYNFLDEYYMVLKDEEMVPLVTVWSLYKSYCDDANVTYPLKKRIFKEELKNYFNEFQERGRDENGTYLRNVYIGFKTEKFDYKNEKKSQNDISHEVSETWLKFDSTESIFDKEYANCPAQYANDKGTPLKKWAEVDTVLSDIQTGELHYVRVPENHIVIDFDLCDEDGNKSYSKNLEAARQWPETYAELSKSGSGIHLHYIYSGDTSKLSRVYSDNVEVKVFTGNSSLRRKLTKCNSYPIKTLSSNLPMKEEKKMINFETVKNERGIRAVIQNCLNKKHHGATKPEVDYIYKILEEAYTSGIAYDVTDLRPRILAFANNSSNQAEYCVKLVAKMHFCSEIMESAVPVIRNGYSEDAEIAFFDVEVFPNLFVICWKFFDKEPVIKMINPSPSDVEKLILGKKLIGFNCRRYDNHILYARILGYSNLELFKLSQKIIGGSKNAMFGEAYNLSYTDIYDFAAKKQSLKKWEIELGIHHQELGLGWDAPVDEKLWPTVADYCVNDVVATEATFKHLQPDFLAREILADITGLTVNDTTNKCTTALIVGDEKNPQDKFVYTDLSEMFPGYKFEAGKSTYRGEIVGEGGYVYAEPGIYQNIALLDIASMHPNSAINLNIFGPYTKNFQELVNARLYIKHGDYESAGRLFGGKLKPYLKSKEQAKKLAYALKIAINSVYGLTAAKFDNKLRDPRNVDNIVAKRGALFMIDLKHKVQEMGYTVVHIKTDSIKVADADDKIINFIMDYGKQYGYTFEHEATYSKICLVNDAVYIAKYADKDEWTATGTQFQIPYVFKTLFSHEPIIFSDLCETKTVSTALYLDMNENLPNEEHEYQFIGKAGLFCPIKPGCGGGILLREKDGKYYAATGSKGFRWLEAEMVKTLGKEDDIDRTYYTKLVDNAVKDISVYGDFEWFVS